MATWPTWPELFISHESQTHFVRVDAGAARPRSSFCLGIHKLGNIYTYTNVGALFVIPPPGLHRQINMLRRCMQQEFSFPFSSLAPPHCFF